MVERDVKKCIAEFEKFYDLLMASAPPDYKPWFFPCQPYGKDPAIDAIKALNWGSKGSWHHSSARLDKDKCIEHLKRGYNIGISARDKDPLVIIDIDNEKFLNQAPKDTLLVTSRKRCGLHAFCWAADKSVKVNIPTDKGEVRSNDQYVLACGSFVPFNLDKPTDESDTKAIKAWLKEKTAYDKLDEAIKCDEWMGYYTIKNPIPPRPITYEEFPSFFREKDQDNKATDMWVKLRSEFSSTSSKYSDLFQLKLIDIVGDIKGRVGHPLHESDTDANFSLGDGGVLGHCWRHMVSLTPVQYLCVKAGYAKCEDAGTPHHKGRESKLKGDKKALDVAYDQAIKDRLIQPRPEVTTDMVEIILPITNKLISTFASEVIAQIKDRQELFYRYREFKVQKLETMPVKDVKNREVKVLGFKEIFPNELITYIEKYVIPGAIHKDKETKQKWFEKRSMGAQLAKTLLESAQFKDNLPLIDVIYDVPLPILVDNKLIFPKEGYDERFQSWLPHGSPAINPNLSLKDATLLLDEIYGEFCFEKPQDKINAIAGLITPFIRGLYVRPTIRTPIFFYNANREGAGKDYCAEVTSIVMQGVANSEPPLADGKETHDEEFRKKILATFRLGKNRLHMSNNKGFLNSAQLEFISTNENFSDRVLGSNTTLSFPNTLELSLSANTGITYTPDLVRRCVFVNLFLGMENPNERQFRKPDLHGWVKEHRSDVLSALYALVRNWHEKGMPGGTTMFASYPEWSRVCGGIMACAELGDPCLPNIDPSSIGGDTETNDMKKLFELVFEKFGDKKLLKREVMDLIMDDKQDGFNELFQDLDWTRPHSAKTKMALMIDKYVGRDFSGIRLIRYDRGVGAHKERRLYSWARPSNQIGRVGSFGSVLHPHNIENNNFSVDLTEGGNPPKTTNPPIETQEEYIPVGICLPKDVIQTSISENNISLKDTIMAYVSNHKDGIKISDLQLELGVDFDHLVETIDRLKNEREIFENPSGTIRRLEV